MSHPASVDAVAADLFQVLAPSFPVACGSDEFPYFPRVCAATPQGSAWDLYSAEAVDALARRLSSYETELERLGSAGPGLQDLADVNLLLRTSRTLREQLVEVRSWETQPTLYLTTLAVGLAEARESGDPAAVQRRVLGLPEFLDRACVNLTRVPAMFRDLGMEMLPGTQQYLTKLAQARPDLNLSPALAALKRLGTHLETCSGGTDFRLPLGLVERIFQRHTGSGLGIRDIRRRLAREEQAMRSVLAGDSAKRLADAPLPVLGTGGLLGLYREEIDRLADHCVNQGWIHPELVCELPVRVERVPARLSGIRTASSYAVSPGDPPSGGVFYVLGDDVGAARRREYRMLAAHETYPGHHLLDSSRLRLDRSVRRAVEWPLFYEGWACFAEHLMRETGYLDGPVDELLLAKRRLWRAVRGRVDVGLHTGEMSAAQAATLLCETGLDPSQAMSAARKYSLNPGYQVCYTLGLQRFLGLFDRHGRGKTCDFVRGVLKHGEPTFEDLDRLLLEG